MTAGTKASPQSLRPSWARLQQLAPLASTALRQLDASNADGPLPLTLVELVKVRVSHINGCEFCEQLHWQKALSSGVSAGQLAALRTWREAHAFSNHERLALEWSEALTHVSNGNSLSDSLYKTIQSELGDAGLAQLSLCVATINAWNRLAVAYAFK
jgi:AhpD family alkylhydroperoxidase